MLTEEKVWLTHCVFELSLASLYSFGWCCYKRLETLEKNEEEDG